MEDYKDYAGLGVAGNFALHLKQAGELKDFESVKVADENGPKGIFPFYMPGAEGRIGLYPLSSDIIVLPEENVNVQPEPEVALLCDIVYEGGRVTAIRPTHFAAFNDNSIRKEGASKISEKKNWGEASKGISSRPIAIDRFEAGGVMDSWHIASFLRREDVVLRYGEDVELTGYSYFYRKLIDWLVNQINSQQNEGPLEPVGDYLAAAGNPERAIISIGATRYIYFCEKTYIHEDDEVMVILYDGNLYKQNDMLQMAYEGRLDGEGISALVQQVRRA
jgi:hypothetical protein